MLQVVNALICLPDQNVLAFANVLRVTVIYEEDASSWWIYTVPVLR